MGPQEPQDQEGMESLQRAGQEGAQGTRGVPMEALPLLSQRYLQIHIQETIQDVVSEDPT